MTNQEPLPNGLPSVQRLITTHNSSGKAIFETSIPSRTDWETIDASANFFLAYTTRTFPVSLAPPKTATSTEAETSSVPTDITSYAKDLESPPGLAVPNGTVLRFVDMAPNALSPMHRTVSIDYGVVLEGAVELILDSGETRVMQRGDVCVQRASMHAWRNVSENGGWTRMLFVLVAADEGESGLGEDLSDKDGILIRK